MLVAAGQTAEQDFTLLGFGDITGTVLAGGAPLANVTVDLVSSSGQIDFVATATDGSFAFEHVTAGAAEVSIVVSLGYVAMDPVSGSASVSVVAGQTVVRDFALEPLPDAGPARMIGYWKHQANVYMTGRGNAQETLTAMSETYPSLIFEHFYNNQLVSIDVLGVTFLEGPLRMTLESMHEALSVRQGTALDRAKQQYLSLLLNVASNRLRSTSVVSADGATASQAIQQIADQIKDGNTANDNAAKELADMINSGIEVPAGVIDLSAPVIPYAPRHAQATGPVRVTPNPLVRSATVEFDVGRAGPMSVQVFDAGGRLVATLATGEVLPGPQRVVWDGTDPRGRSVANGIYFYRIATPDRVLTTRFAVMLR